MPSLTRKATKAGGAGVTRAAPAGWGVAVGVGDGLPGVGVLAAAGAAVLVVTSLGGATGSAVAAGATGAALDGVGARVVETALGGDSLALATIANDALDGAVATGATPGVPVLVNSVAIGTGDADRVNAAAVGVGLPSA